VAPLEGMAYGETGNVSGTFSGAAGNSSATVTGCSVFWEASVNGSMLLARISPFDLPLLFETAFGITSMVACRASLSDSCPRIRQLQIGGRVDVQGERIYKL
jgi:hypothetical protein